MLLFGFTEEDLAFDEQDLPPHAARGVARPVDEFTWEVESSTHAGLFYEVRHNGCETTGDNCPRGLHNLSDCSHRRRVQFHLDRRAARLKREQPSPSPMQQRRDPLDLRLNGDRAFSLWRR